jgi:membrane protease YdiL (CAAX protease family)
MDRDDGNHNGYRPAFHQHGIWRWGTLRLAMLAVLWSASNLVAQTIAYAYTGDMFAAVSAGGLFVMLLATIAVRSQHGTLTTDFGLDRPPVAVVLLTFLAALTALLPSSFLAGLSSQLHPPSTEWITYYNEHFPDTPLRIGVAILAVTIFGPIAEELVFRGVIYRLGRRHWGFLPAALISSLAFGLAHGEPWFLFGLVGLGVLLAYIYERTRSLTACIVTHAVHNGVSLALMFKQGNIVDLEALSVPTDWLWLGVSLCALVVVIMLIHRLGHD